MFSGSPLPGAWPLIGGLRSAIAFRILNPALQSCRGPAAGAPSQVDWRRKSVCGDPSIDRGAA